MNDKNCDNCKFWNPKGCPERMGICESQMVPTCHICGHHARRSWAYWCCFWKEYEPESRQELAKAIIAMVEKWQEGQA